MKKLRFALFMMSLVFFLASCINTQYNSAPNAWIGYSTSPASDGLYVYKFYPVVSDMDGEVIYIETTIDGNLFSENLGSESHKYAVGGHIGRWQDSAGLWHDPNTQYGEIITYDFEKEGDYSVKILAIDDSGGSAIYERLVEVRDWWNGRFE